MRHSASVSFKVHTLLPEPMQTYCQLDTKERISITFHLIPENAIENIVCHISAIPSFPWVVLSISHFRPPQCPRAWLASVCWPMTQNGLSNTDFTQNLEHRFSAGFLLQPRDRNLCYIRTELLLNSYKKLWLSWYPKYARFEITIRYDLLPLSEMVLLRSGVKCRTLSTRGTRSPHLQDDSTGRTICFYSKFNFGLLFKEWRSPSTMAHVRFKSTPTWLETILWPLTHWGRNKMDDISQTTISKAFSWMKMFNFRFTFHGSLFLRFELIIFQHLIQKMAWRRSCDKPISKPTMVMSLTYICVTRPQRVNTLRTIQNCRQFADDIFKPILLNENCGILIQIP